MANTLGGALETSTGPVKITGMGRTWSSGWQRAATFLGSKLPGGTGDYVFVIFGVMGNTSWRDPYLPSKMRIEVGVGTAANGYAWPQFMETSGISRAGKGAHRGYPFCFIIDAATDAPTLNQATTDLVVWARGNVELETKQHIANAQPSFEILECQVMVFDKTVIPAPQRYFSRTIVNRHTTGFLGTWDPVAAPAATFGGLGEKWLIFVSAAYEPHNDLAVAMRVTCGGVDCFGYKGATSPVATQYGTRSSVYLTASGKRGYQDHHNLGGFTVRTLAAAEKLQLQFAERHNNTGGYAGRFSYVNHFRAFAVRLDTFTAEIIYDRATLEAKQQFIHRSSTPSRLTREFDVNVPQKMAILSCAIRRTRQGGSYAMDIALGDVTTDGTDVMAHEGALHHSRSGEGVPIVAIGEMEPFPPDQHMVQSLVHNPHELGSGLKEPADDVSWIAFDFETAPEGSGYPNETPGADVVIVPGKEADATGLPEWPIAPRGTWAEETDLELENLRTANGYRITWPKFLVPREQAPITWSWSGLTKADFDTLRTFVIDQAVLAVKWKRPEDTAYGVWHLIGAAEFAEEKGLYRMQIQGLQLVYGTGITPRVLT